MVNIAASQKHGFAAARGSIPRIRTFETYVYIFLDVDFKMKALKNRFMLIPTMNSH
jgi:hypothetical protein